MWNLGLLGAAAAGPGVELFGGTFDLLQVQNLVAPTNSVTFSGLSGYSAGYQNLRISLSVRSDKAASDFDNVSIFLNGSTAQYATQYMETNGSAYPNGSGGTNNALIKSTGGNMSSMYSPAMIDFIDPFDSTAYVKYVGLTSMPSAGSTEAMIRMFSGKSNNTGALDSITFQSDSGSNFTAESRFSIYGLKGA